MLMVMKQAAIFDLDGVIVDTAKYHYLAWKRLASELGFEFSSKQNERLKGVSRMKSLEFLLESGGMQDKFSQREKEALAERKNQWYVEMISKINREELLPGAEELLQTLRQHGIAVVLGSASKNAPIILEGLQIAHLFDAVVDGTMVTEAKPDPQVFLLGAHITHTAPENCAVFEDSQAGIDAGNQGGMYTIGIGKGLLHCREEIDGLFQAKNTKWYQEIFSTKTGEEEQL